MAKRGRKPSQDPTEPFKFWVPKSVMASVDLRLLNPLTGSPMHGERSELVTLLLRAWLQGEINVPLRSQSLLFAEEPVE